MARDPANNPYAAPQVSGIVGDIDSARIRERHVKLELVLRLAFVPFAFQTLVLCFVTVIFLHSFFVEHDESLGPFGTLAFAMSSFLSASAVVGVRHFRPWGPWLAFLCLALEAVACLWIVAEKPRAWISIAFLFGLVVLPATIVLLLKPTRYLFRPEYARIRAATPEIRHRVSASVWLLLGALIVATAVFILIKVDVLPVGLR